MEFWESLKNSILSWWNENESKFPSLECEALSDKLQFSKRSDKTRLLPVVDVIPLPGEDPAVLVNCVKYSRMLHTRNVFFYGGYLVKPDSFDFDTFSSVLHYLENDLKPTARPPFIQKSLRVDVHKLYEKWLSQTKEKTAS